MHTYIHACMHTYIQQVMWSDLVSSLTSFHDPVIKVKHKYY